MTLATRAHPLLRGALLIAGLAYPAAVYFAGGQFSPRLFALLLGGLWLARLLLERPRAGNRALALGALAFCAVLGLLDDPLLLRGYPVLLSLVLLAVFAASLRSGMPVIERLARLREPELPDSAVRYTRQVTRVWALFFAVNAALAAGLALWAPLSWWALYTGLIAYLLMGLLFAGEWLVRQRVRRHP